MGLVVGGVQFGVSVAPATVVIALLLAYAGAVFVVRPFALAPQNNIEVGSAVAQVRAPVLGVAPRARRALQDAVSVFFFSFFSHLLSPSLSME